MSVETFLVTGCAGFIGGHMVRRLLKEGFAVAGVDDFSSGRRANMADFQDRIRFVEGDLSSPRVAAEAVAGVDRIIHLASIPSVPRSLEKPMESAQSSVMATVALLEASWRAGVRRVVQASSSAVYGDAGDGAAAETWPYKPGSPYAAAKIAQENYARVFALQRGLDTVSLRYFNVFGSGQDPDGDYAAVIPKFIAAMLAGDRPVIFGDGSQTRDFIQVDDVVEANLAAALAKLPFGGEAINIGRGGGLSVNSLVRELNRVLGTDLKPIYAPARPGDILHSRSDPGQAEKLLGFRPRVDLAEGLARAAGVRI
ncbi:MAG: NAD-dependent epimerase/dehydratase family protein [Candidatus Adiutrix sp.]|jgi:nucleoside-diphosphate-sugar epimerase|nr:NAD-dependent epimerase/dehydratase family protein [Candidatus Adiutrix sp.]